MRHIYETVAPSDVIREFDGHDYARPAYWYDGATNTMRPNNDKGLLARVTWFGACPLIHRAKLGDKLADACPLPVGMVEIYEEDQQP